MINRLKLTIILTPLALILIIGIYVYSLWAEERKKTEEMPQEAIMMLVRDLIRYHEKRGGFPENLGNLEKVVWREKKQKRQFSKNKRALNHRNYYYFYSKISHHKFTLWAIPTGNFREDSPTWFVVSDSRRFRRWKGTALPFELVEKIKPSPSLNGLGVFGLIEQPNLKLKKK